ncbi:ferric iron ABC transporter [Gracilibacillus boraciitolerans JCM 21714]|uniref:Ferric iron ABC transporter n=1 Tax=Gracilibacillus boraciitolerans JCM 21714 TaxID=1298598 RepID=W4VGV6_9BACI|nr:extracellular solute-binding protein [Gracilibacillus boraciitolerans]GAE92053.1 ferric iron ABC transporter [Gracilibacillus boraciitolerans JCM 21714]
MKKLCGISFVFSLLFAVGCSQDETNAKGGDNQSEPLVVYLNDFDEIIEPLFEEATGYDVELVSGNGAEVQSRIEAEKGNPNWDVVWMDGQAAFARWDEEEVLLKDLDLKNIDSLNELGTSLLPESNSYVATGAHASSVIVYNTNEISEAEAPKEWSDLASPNLKDSVGMADPAVAAPPAYPFVTWFFQNLGMDNGKQFFTNIFENGAKVYPKNPNIVEALLNGDIKAAALQESNAYTMKANGEPIEIIWPEEGAPASVRYVGINKQSENKEAAEAFVNFLLEKETQDELVAAGSEGYFSPTVSDVADLDERPEDPKLVIAEGDWSAEHEAEIKEWFADQSVE